LLFLALIGLLVVILAVLPYVISLEGVKERIVAQAETALQRDVDIGQVRLQLLTGLGAGLEQLTISNPPGWQRPDFVKVGTLSVKVAFWPLLQRNIEVSRLILSDGEIVIERDDKGRMNYDDLVAPKPGTEKAPPAPPPDTTPRGTSPLAGLLVSKVSLRNVDVTFIDRQVVPGKSLTTTAQDVQVDITDVALNTPIDFSMAASLLTDGGRNVKLRGRLGPIPASMEFDQTPLDVTLQAQDLVLDSLTPYMGPEPALTAGRLGADLTVQGKLGGTLDLKGSLSLAQAVLPTTTDGGKPAPLPEVKLSQEITVDMEQAMLQLAYLRLDLTPLQATLKGTVRDFMTTPQLDLRLSTNAFAPGEVLPQLPMLAAALPEPTEVQGELQLDATVQGTPRDLRATSQLTTDTLTLQSGSLQEATPQGGMRLETTKMQANLKAHLADPRPPDVELELNANQLLFDQQAATASESPPPTPGSSPAPAAPPLNLRGNIRIAEGRVKQLSFEQLRADLSLLNGLLKSTQAFRMYGGAYEGQVQANLAQAAPEYTVQVQLADLNAGKAVNELTSVHDVLFGKLNTDLNFSGKGFTWEAISTTLTGKGKVAINDLKVTTLDLMPKLAAGLQTVSTLTGFTVPANLTERSFDTLRSTLRIVEGKIYSDDVNLWGPDVELSGEGFLGLDQSLKFEGIAFLLNQLANSFGPRAAFLKDEKGRIAVPLAIQGSITQPQVALNESYLAEAAKKALTKGIEESAGKELQKLLNKDTSEKGEAPAKALQDVFEKGLPGKPAEQSSSQPSGTNTEPAQPESRKEQTPQQQLEKTLKGLFKPRR
jgi:AsmA protein